MGDDSSKDVATGEQSGEGGVETELSRDMSLFDITFIGVGAMIGAGVFALTGFAAGLAGPALTLAFLLNGFVAMFTAVSYAELGAAFPEAGGGYLWVKEALVDPNGFYAGWMSWFAHAVACSLYAVTFGVFLVELVVYSTGLPHEFHLLGFITPIMAEKGLSVLMVAAFAYINYRGAEETGKAGVIVTGIKIVILGAFIAFGAYATVTAPQWTDKFFNSPSFAPNGLFGIIGAMGFTYIAFEGYEIIVQSGEEVVDPGSNIPKAVFYSMAIVVPIYILVAFASIGGIDVTQRIIGLAEVSGQQNVYTWELLGELGELGIIRAAGQFMPYGVPLLLFAGLAATMSALNATVYSSSRVSFAMGRDRALPGVFNNIHPDKRTPHWAIFISAILIAAMAVILPIEAVAASADIMFILLFVQVNWTVVRMRETHPDLPRTYEVPFMPWPPLIGIVLQIILTPFLIYTLGLEALGIGESNHGLIALVTTAVWMGLGLLIYYGYSKQQEAEQLEEETPTLVTEHTPSEAEGQIVVPIANPENAAQLMRTAVDIARDKDAEILVMSVVTVPQQTPISEGREFVTDEREVLNEAMDVAEDAGVPVNGTIRIGHDVAEAILNTVEQYDCEMVLMGWKGQHKSQRRDIVLGSNVDTVAQKADADVLVERIGGAGDVESILVPTAGGPHADLAAEIARAIARTTGADVDVMHVVEPNADDQRREEAQNTVESTTAILEGVDGTNTSIVEGDDIATTVVEESDAYDLTVVGATREGLLKQFVFGAVPEQIGWEAKSTVIMAKRNIDITSTLSRWLGP
ncbi:amino acid permease [Halorussus gelatinilyticus]|uniref:Amino acid permease n=1 Tax=Halorussus gelatinilyticus TaxID=2937524 RepID=A0A8U0IJH8_9EURY|nr:amino acid permease [Halorussus gelatinilyticus]UPW00938.1 amino acid permease [Halorussus gelatinilyticus]